MAHVSSPQIPSTTDKRSLDRLYFLLASSSLAIHTFPSTLRRHPKRRRIYPLSQRPLSRVKATHCVVQLRQATAHHLHQHRNNLLARISLTHGPISAMATLSAAGNEPQNPSLTKHLCLVFLHPATKLSMPQCWMKTTSCLEMRIMETTTTLLRLIQISSIQHCP